MDDKNKSAVKNSLNIDYGSGAPILYTDFVYMSTNKDGLTLDVCQKIGPTNKMKVVARIGVSREFAKKFVNDMGKLLAMSEGHTQTGRKN